MAGAGKVDRELSAMRRKAIHHVRLRGGSYVMKNKSLVGHWATSRYCKLRVGEMKDRRAATRYGS